MMKAKANLPATEQQSTTSSIEKKKKLSQMIKNIHFQAKILK